LLWAYRMPKPSQAPNKAISEAATDNVTGLIEQLPTLLSDYPQGLGASQDASEIDTSERDAPSEVARSSPALAPAVGDDAGSDESSGAGPGFPGFRSYDVTPEPASSGASEADELSPSGAARLGTYRDSTR
jgi:hypothetical protein